MDFVKVVRSINLTSPSWDLFVLIAFLAGIYFYIFRWGKDKAFINLLSAYTAMAIVSRLSLFEKVTGMQLENIFVNKAFLFLLLAVILSWIISHSDFISVFRHGGKRAWFEILVISFLQIGLIVSIFVSLLPAQEAKNLSIFLKTVFAGNEAQAFWLVSPFLAMLFLKEK